MDFTTRNVIFRGKKLQTQKIHLTMTKAFKIFMEDFGIGETFFFCRFRESWTFKKGITTNFFARPHYEKKSPFTLLKPLSLDFSFVCFSKGLTNV